MLPAKTRPLQGDGLTMHKDEYNEYILSKRAEKTLNAEEVYKLKILPDGDHVRMQVTVDTREKLDPKKKRTKMLIDCYVHKTIYPEFREHLIEGLTNMTVDKLFPKEPQVPTKAP